MPFLVCGDFCGESGLWKLGLGGIHPLTQRYMLSKSVSKRELKMILNHVSVGVSNVASAVAFYDSVLSALSVRRSHYIENVAAAYGENFEFWVGCPCENGASSGNGTHIAFNAPSKEAVDLFYATALELGGSCAGKPGLRPEYGETYYAAFVRDADGNKVEAVFM
ncbi:VOC family protein [Vibrio vulnificus]|nr:VOC family protein [Vibrio vulnificus]